MYIPLIVSWSAVHIYLRNEETTCLNISLFLRLNASDPTEAFIFIKVRFLRFNRFSISMFLYPLWQCFLRFLANNELSWDSQNWNVQSNKSSMYIVCIFLSGFFPLVFKYWIDLVILIFLLWKLLYSFCWSIYAPDACL